MKNLIRDSFVRKVACDIKQQEMACELLLSEIHKLEMTHKRTATVGYKERNFSCSQYPTNNYLFELDIQINT